MKIHFFVAFVLLYAACVHSNGIRVKRGLTSEEKKKLVDALIVDRRNFAMEHDIGGLMGDMEYDTKLEEQVDTLESGGECYNSKASFVPLKVDKATFDGLKKIEIRLLSAFNAPLFDPTQTKIGCSTKHTCFDKLPNDDYLGEIAGTTATLYGMCLLGPNTRPIKELVVLSLDKYSGMTKIGKYGDLLGVSAGKPSSSSAQSSIPVESKGGEPSESKGGETSSSGRIFGLTVFLGLLVFYY